MNIKWGIEALSNNAVAYTVQCMQSTHGTVCMLYYMQCSVICTNLCIQNVYAQLNATACDCWTIVDKCMVNYSN